MKITSIESFLLGSPPGGEQRLFAQRRIAGRRLAMMVKVSTDEGIVGWGQCGAPVQQSVKAVLDQEVAPLLIGQDPFLIEELWQRVVGAFSPFGIQGMVFMALSGIDIALHDIKGKALNMPIWRLLGAKYRDKVMAYASGPYYRVDEKIPEHIVEDALAYVGEGYKALKIKIGGMDPKDDVRRVEAVRKAVGDDITIMVDANQAYNAHTAIRVGKEFERLDVFWFEEPVPSVDLDGYARVRQALRIAIAGGEIEWSRFGFRDLITHGCVDIVQPDLGDSGGFTECRRIATIADAFGVQCVPHVVSASPVALPAALHWCAVLRDFPPTRTPTPFNQIPVLEFHQHKNSLRDLLTTTPIEAVDGWVTIPDGPGLGVEIDEKAVRQYQV